MIVFGFVFKLCSLRVNTLYQGVQTSRDEHGEFGGKMEDKVEDIGR